MSNCTKCNKESEFDSPDNLCAEHWIEWFTEGWDWKTTEEEKEYKDEWLKNHNNPQWLADLLM